MTDTFSPVLHRIDQAVRWRAVHPTDPIPSPYEILTRFSQPPEEILGEAKRRLDKLIRCAEVKKGKLPQPLFNSLLIVYSSAKGKGKKEEERFDKAIIRT